MEAEWWDLWHRAPGATAFQSPAWLLPWRRMFGDGETKVLTIREGGRLMGLLPLFRYEGRFLPWGAGTTDWLDGLFDPALAMDAITEALSGLDAPLDLPQLPPGARLLDAPLPRGWTERRGEGEPCPALALPAELPRNMAQNLRYYRRRAERAGVGAPERGGPGLFADLADLHARRWAPRGEPGVLADPRVRAWHAEALPLLEAAGMLRLYAMRRGGRVVAALYALMSKGRVHYYIGGFDPDLETLGLGTVLVGHAVAEAEREGAHTFDFLRGREAYKYRWGAADVPARARLLSPPGR